MLSIPDGDVRVLIVERDGVLCDHTATHLAAYRTVATTSCEHALQLLQQQAFDCYVVDIQLDDGTAGSLCSAIRCTDPNAPIVVYSASDSMAGSDALLLGANVLLRHPADGGALAPALDGLLHMQRMRIERARRAAYEAMHEEVVGKINALLAQTALVWDGNARWSAAWNALIQDSTARLQACQAFLGGGGTRANFERIWPELVQQLKPDAPQRSESPPTR